MPSVMPLDWVQILEHTQDNSQNQNLRVDLNHVPGNGQEYRKQIRSNITKENNPSKSDSPNGQPWSVCELPESK